MDYEKKYKDALERARKSHDKANGLIKKEWIETIFPELKENEDEKIRKQILSFLKEFECDHYRNLDFSSWIAWLEKQGGQKSSKFKVGDWIICAKFNTALVLDIENGKYFAEFVDGSKGFHDIDYIDNHFHLWTIDDAKDGDVLAIGNEYFLFKGKIKHNTSSVYISHCFLDSAGAFRVTNGVDCGEFFPIENGIKVHPATKEQRDILFQKMKEAGYNLNKEEE